MVIFFKKNNYSSKNNKSNINNIKRYRNKHIENTFSVYTKNKKSNVKGVQFKNKSVILAKKVNKFGLKKNERKNYKIKHGYVNKRHYFFFNKKKHFKNFKMFSRFGIKKKLKSAFFKRFNSIYNVHLRKYRFTTFRAFFLKKLKKNVLRRLHFQRTTLLRKRYFKFFFKIKNFYNFFSRSAKKRYFFRINKYKYCLRYKKFRKSGVRLRFFKYLRNNLINSGLNNNFDQKSKEKKTLSKRKRFFKRLTWWFSRWVYKFFPQSNFLIYYHNYRKCFFRRYKYKHGVLNKTYINNRNYQSNIVKLRNRRSFLKYKGKRLYNNFKNFKKYQLYKYFSYYRKLKNSYRNKRYSFFRNNFFKGKNFITKKYYLNYKKYQEYLRYKKYQIKNYLNNKNYKKNDKGNLTNKKKLNNYFSKIRQNKSYQGNKYYSIKNYHNKVNFKNNQNKNYLNNRNYQNNNQQYYQTRNKQRLYYQSNKNYKKNVNNRKYDNGNLTNKSKLNTRKYFENKKSFKYNRYFNKYRNNKKLIKFRSNYKGRNNYGYQRKYRKRRIYRSFISYLNYKYFLNWWYFSKIKCITFLRDRTYFLSKIQRIRRFQIRRFGRKFFDIFFPKNLSLSYYMRKIFLNNCTQKNLFYRFTGRRARYIRFIKKSKYLHKVNRHLKKLLDKRFIKLKRYLSRKFMKKKRKKIKFLNKFNFLVRKYFLSNKKYRKMFYSFLPFNTKKLIKLMYLQFSLKDFYKYYILKLFKNFYFKFFFFKILKELTKTCSSKEKYWFLKYEFFGNTFFKTKLFYIYKFKISLFFLRLWNKRKMFKNLKKVAKVNSYYFDLKYNLIKRMTENSSFIKSWLLNFYLNKYFSFESLNLNVLKEYIVNLKKLFFFQYIIVDRNFKTYIKYNRKFVNWLFFKVNKRLDKKKKTKFFGLYSTLKYKIKQYNKYNIYFTFKHGYTPYYNPKCSHVYHERKLEYEKEKKRVTGISKLLKTTQGFFWRYARRYRSLTRKKIVEANKEILLDFYQSLVIFFVSVKLNNVFMTLSKVNGDVLFKYSTGLYGVCGRKKRDFNTVYEIANRVCRRLKHFVNLNLLFKIKRRIRNRYIKQVVKSFKFNRIKPLLVFFVGNRKISYRKIKKVRRK